MMSWKFGHIWLKIIKQAPLSLKNRQPPTSEMPHDISDLANMVESQQRAWRWWCFGSSANLIENEEGPQCAWRTANCVNFRNAPQSVKISQHGRQPTMFPEMMTLRKFSQFDWWPSNTKFLGGHRVAGSQKAKHLYMMTFWRLWNFSSTNVGDVYPNQMPWSAGMVRNLSFK